MAHREIGNGVGRFRVYFYRKSGRGIKENLYTPVLKVPD